MTAIEAIPLKVKPVTTPLVKRALAVAGVLVPPPLNVTAGGNAYPEPPLVRLIGITVPALSVAVAAAWLIGLRISAGLSLVAVTVNVSPLLPAPRRCRTE